ncbi:MAG TPA: hypothetical protein VEU32_20860 [Burkholderiales bacterium]|nr:hypothetical protein [Burkholderiales bacterium]
MRLTIAALAATLIGADALAQAGKWGGTDPQAAPQWRPSPAQIQQAPARTISTPPLAFEGMYAGSKTIQVAALAFEGLYAGTKTIAVAPLAFEGLYAGVKTVVTAPLAFEGMAAPPAGFTKGGRR